MGSGKPPQGQPGRPTSSCTKGTCGLPQIPWHQACFPDLVCFRNWSHGSVSTAHSLTKAAVITPHKASHFLNPSLKNSRGPRRHSTKTAWRAFRDKAVDTGNLTSQLISTQLVNVESGSEKAVVQVWDRPNLRHSSQWYLSTRPNHLPRRFPAGDKIITSLEGLILVT